MNEPEVGSNPEKKSSVWWSRIVSALLGITVTVAGALIVQRLETREPRLTYSSVETVPFNGPNDVVGIYQVVLQNEGKKEVEDVGCYIRIPGAKIEQHRTITAPSLITTDSVTNDILRVSIPSLNPGETAQVSVLASNPSFLPLHPDISVRAKGIMGTEQKSGAAAKSETILPFLSATTIAFAALLFTFLSRLLITRGKGDVGSGSQRQVLASICKANGFVARAEGYAKAARLTYYGEADRLGQEATQSEDPRTTSEIKTILTALSIRDDTIKDSSRSIVLYNLSRILAKEQKINEALDVLRRARSFDAEEVDGRHSIDHMLKDIKV
jgi:hypothetical protein